MPRVLGSRDAARCFVCRCENICKNVNRNIDHTNYDKRDTFHNYGNAQIFRCLNHIDKVILERVHLETN